MIGRYMPTQTGIERGIARTKHGYKVHVRIKGEVFTKRFKRGTPMQQMRDWLSRTSFRQRYRDMLAHELPPALPRSPKGWCYLYVIAGDGVAKIGRAIDPAQRLRELQTGHAGVLTIIAAVPGHADLERAAHEHFAHLKLSGEWFRLTDELADFVRWLQAGLNPIAFLWETMRTGKPQSPPAPARPAPPRCSDATAAQWSDPAGSVSP
jgi:hypothetical protein